MKWANKGGIRVLPRLCLLCAAHCLCAGSVILILTNSLASLYCIVVFVPDSQFVCRTCVSAAGIPPVLCRLTWEQPLLEGRLVHCLSSIYFLTGSSVMLMVVRVSHGLASELLLARLGHKPDIKSLDMHLRNWWFINLCSSQSWRSATILIHVGFIELISASLSGECKFVPTFLLLWAPAEHSLLVGSHDKQLSVKGNVIH